MPGIPEVGQTVLVRGRPFVVEQLLASALPQNSSTVAPPQTLIQLSSLEDDSLGEQLEVVWVWCWVAERGYDLLSRNPLIYMVGSTGLEPVAPAV